ncbi:MAG: hypothetical protein HFI96_18040 [Lachnospiraceae bacterium]|nr:hypothetical protein [Lachnospiraceae bacterium]
MYFPGSLNLHHFLCRSDNLQMLGQTSRETISDKIKRMLKNEIRQM